MSSAKRHSRRSVACRPALLLADDLPLDDSPCRRPFAPRMPGPAHRRLWCAREVRCVQPEMKFLPRSTSFPARSAALMALLIAGCQMALSRKFRLWPVACRTAVADRVDPEAPSAEPRHQP